ncbi:MAG: hypothetical protein ACFFB5_12425 [Promethearchaeota archaeon]
MSEIRNKLLATENLDPKAQSLLLQYVLVDSIRLVAFNISSMFIILFLLDTLESTEVGILFAVSYLILTLIDYPTGVLGDLIGYKKVMMLAYFFHIISFILLIFSETFVPLLFYSACSAIASSQESGALESWFDNNYRMFTQATDPERQIYKAFQARISILIYALSGLSFIAGGMIAQYLSRKFLFGVSLFLIILVFILIIGVIKDYNSFDQSDFTMRVYFSQFLGGFRFLFSQKGILLFFVGTTIIWAANNSIWVNFLLFPIYEGYSGGQDHTTAMFRAIIFASGVLWQLFIVKYINKLTRIKLWIFITTAFSNVIFFFAIFLYYSWFPPITFDLMLLLGLFIVFQLPGMWEPLEFILRNRLNLDLVPDNIRNAVYSLLPTLTTLIGIPGALIGGYYLKYIGFAETVLFTSLFSGLGVLLTGVGLLWLPEIREQIKKERN